jgi:upstream activation factor subunit UAF30
MAKLQQLAIAISGLKSEYRVLEKKWSRELKVAQKQTNRRKRKAGNRAPSGFVKPTKISDELASFLGKDKGTEMARTDVTREINTYIRNNKLQDKENGRKINPDKKLAALLKLNTTDELTYFNLQKYMSPHFAKAVKDVVTA